MKKILKWAASLAALLVLTGCAGKEPAQPKWEATMKWPVEKNIWTSQKIN